MQAPVSPTNKHNLLNIAILKTWTFNMIYVKLLLERQK